MSKGKKWNKIFSTAVPAWLMMMESTCKLCEYVINSDVILKGFK